MSISPLTSRYLAIALLFGVIGLFSLFFILPIVQYITDLNEKIQEDRTLLGRLKAFSDDEKATKIIVEQAEALKKSGLFLRGNSEQLQLARLQTDLNDITQSRGVRLLSARTVPARDEKGLRLLGIQTEFETDLKQLQSILQALDQNRPVLFFDTIQITALPDRRPDVDILRVRLGILGVAYTLKDAQP